MYVLSNYIILHSFYLGVIYYFLLLYKILYSNIFIIFNLTILLFYFLKFNLLLFNLYTFLCLLLIILVLFLYFKQQSYVFFIYAYIYSCYFFFYRIHNNIFVNIKYLLILLDSFILLLQNLANKKQLIFWKPLFKRKSYYGLFRSNKFFF